MDNDGIAIHYTSGELYLQEYITDTLLGRNWNEPVGKICDKNKVKNGK